MHDQYVDIRSVAGQHKIKLEQVLEAMNLGTLLDGYAAIESGAFDSFSSILQAWWMVIICPVAETCSQLDSAEKIKTLSLKATTRKFPIDAAYPAISRQESEGLRGRCR